MSLQQDADRFSKPNIVSVVGVGMIKIRDAELKKPSCAGHRTFFKTPQIIKKFKITSLLWQTGCKGCMVFEVSQ